jgi:hypothetical protein
MPRRTTDPFTYIGRKLTVVRRLAPQREQQGMPKKSCCVVTLVHAKGIPGWNTFYSKLTRRTFYTVRSHFAQLDDRRPAYHLDCFTASKQPGRRAKTAGSRADENRTPYAAEIARRIPMSRLRVQDRAWYSSRVSSSGGGGKKWSLKWSKEMMLTCTQLHPTWDRILKKLIALCRHTRFGYRSGLLSYNEVLCRSQIVVW